MVKIPSDCWSAVLDADKGAYMNNFNVQKYSKKFRYMLLHRLKADCNYYLGKGMQNAKCLWAGNEQSQIELMKELWESFPYNDKPKWLLWSQIIEYEKKIIPE